MSQHHGRLGRRFHRIIFFGDLKEKFGTALRTGHQRNRLLEQLHILRSRFDTRTEHLLQVLAIGSTATRKTSIELCFRLLYSRSITLENRGQTSVLIQNGIRIDLAHLIIIAQIAEIYQCDIRQRSITALQTGFDRLLIQLAHAFPVGRIESQVFTSFTVKDISRTVIGTGRKILYTQVVNHHQRIEQSFFLIQVLCALHLVRINLCPPNKGRFESRRSLLCKRTEINSGCVVIAGIDSFLQQVARQNVLLTLFGRISPRSVPRVTEILGDRSCRSEHQYCRQQNFHAIHILLYNLFFMCGLIVFRTNEPIITEQCHTENLQ